VKKIVHFSTVHPRSDGRVFQKECSSLATYGFDVYLIVADGKGAEQLNDVSIRDIGRSSYGRIGRLLFKAIQMFFTAKKMKADIYHFHDPELIFVGLALKLCGYKVIYDIHEHLAMQIMHKYWITPCVRPVVSKLFDSLESIACKYFDALLVPQPTMKASYMVKNSKTELIANFVDSSNINFTEPLVYEGKKSYKLVHAGALSDTRGLFNMLDLMHELGPNFQLILAGNFSNNEVMLQAEQHQAWGKVDYKGIIGKDEIEVIYQKSDVGLILYNNVGQYYLSYAIKLFEFMSRGLPVIMPDFGEWPEFNRVNNCGICVDVNSPIEIASAVYLLTSNHQLALELGDNGRNAIKNKFNWQNEESKLIKVYQGILNV
jgi:glycosyltransferase involved in cell wall biosynthesis